MRVALQAAFILRRQAYRETSVLLDVLTRDHGRLAVIVRGGADHAHTEEQYYNPLLLCRYHSLEKMNLCTRIR